MFFLIFKGSCAPNILNSSIGFRKNIVFAIPVAFIPFSELTITLCFCQKSCNFAEGSASQFVYGHGARSYITSGMQLTVIKYKYIKQSLRGNHFVKKWENS